MHPNHPRDGYAYISSITPETKNSPAKYLHTITFAETGGAAAAVFDVYDSDNSGGNVNQIDSIRIPANGQPVMVNYSAKLSVGLRIVSSGAGAKWGARVL